MAARGLNDGRTEGEDLLRNDSGPVQPPAPVVKESQPKPVKKPTASDALKAQKSAIEETRGRVQELMRKLTTHEDAAIFKQALDKNNPHYEEFRQQYRNLTLIEYRFRRGEYATTTALWTDLDDMIFC